MNVTRDIINDLMPLYAADECSADTRALVEEYLQQNPRQAEELRLIMSLPLPGDVPPARSLEETHSFREARRRLGRRNWLMALAIFFSLAPASFLYTDGHLWWLMRDAPGTALVYVALSLVFWTLYFLNRRRSQSL